MPSGSKLYKMLGLEPKPEVQYKPKDETPAIKAKEPKKMKKTKTDE